MFGRVGGMGHAVLARFSPQPIKAGGQVNGTGGAVIAWGRAALAAGA